MTGNGKEEVDQDEEIVYVSCETVWREISRNERFDHHTMECVSMAELPCDLNQLQYAIGENLEMILSVCSGRFRAAHPYQTNPRSTVLHAFGVGPVALVFVRDVIPIEEEEADGQFSEDEISFEEEFSDDQEWGEESEEDE